MRRRASLLVATAVLGCSAASIATVPNLAGVYDLSFTNGDNGCTLPGFTYGESTSGVPVTLTQNPTIMQDMIGCIALPLFAAGDGGAVDARGACDPDAAYDAACPCGQSVLTGTVGGTSVTLVASSGDAGAQQGDCGYTTNAALALSFLGSTAQGTMTYTVTNSGSAACARLAGCQSVQAVGGVLVSPTLGTSPPCDAACE